MADTAGFRAVLHEWARRQLTERSDHVGPFEIVSVRMAYESAKGWSEITFEDALTEVRIQFDHTGRDCPRRRYFPNDICTDRVWSPMDSENTVSMLNQLLAIADESD